MGCNGNAGGLGWTKEGMERWNVIYQETDQQQKQDAALGTASVKESIWLAVLQHWSTKCGKPTTEATGIRMETKVGLQQEGKSECAVVIMDNCLSD